MLGLALFSSVPIFAVVDYSITGSEILFDPQEANLNSVVQISATVRAADEMVDFKTENQDDTALAGGNFSQQNSQWLAQGFVVTSTFLITRVQIFGFDVGALGEATTVDITTGTTSVPSVGVLAIVSTAATTTATSPA